MLYRTLAVLAAMLLGLMLATEFRNQAPEWKQYQQDYRNLLITKAHGENETEEARSFDYQIRQVLAKDLTLIDRCQTCHLGAEDTSLSDVPQPFTGHPEIPRHSFDRFGCLPCHQGQPWGTTKDAAHGHVAFWDKPLLGRTYLQAACGRCHIETEVAGAPVLSRGRQLMKSLQCEECHEIRGLGGNTGPDLTLVGSKHPAAYLRESITNPKANDTNSIMPDFDLSKADVQSLVVALLSLTDQSFPPDLRPKVSDAERVYWTKRLPDSLASGGRLFQVFGCSHCHKAGSTGSAFAGDLSGIGLRMDSDSLFKYIGSSDFIGVHAEIQLLDIRLDQIRLLSDYLSAFKEEVISPNLTVSGPTVESGYSEPIAQPSASLANVSTTRPTPTPSEIRAMTLSLDPGQIDRGKELYKAKNCKMCHKLAGAGGSTGPKLDNVGARRDRDWLFHHFKDPKAIVPGTRMPNFKFSDEDAQALTTYMQTLR